MTLVLENDKSNAEQACVCVWKLRSNFYSLEKSVSPPTDLQSQISMNSRSDSLLFEYIEFFFFF